MLDQDRADDATGVTFFGRQMTARGRAGLFAGSIGAGIAGQDAADIGRAATSRASAAARRHGCAGTYPLPGPGLRPKTAKARPDHSERASRQVLIADDQRRARAFSAPRPA
jgi:hypothetical protein